MIYELHVGTFTPRRHLRRRRATRLDDLAELGITAIELMPLADFPGPARLGLRRRAAVRARRRLRHARRPEARSSTRRTRRGLMVLLDVVYNHFGPDGNYLHAYAPQFFTERHHTPWGAAINFDGAAAARCATSSSTTRSTGSRSSTSTACGSTRCTRSHDDSHAAHRRRDRAARCATGPGATRHVHLVLENDATRRAARARRGGRRGCTTRSGTTTCTTRCMCCSPARRDGYYADYADAPAARFGARARRGLRLPGRAVGLPRRRARAASRARTCRRRAFVVVRCRTTTRSATAPSASASRTLAERRPLRRAARACLLLLRRSPPMLFMGEEFAASHAVPLLLRLRGELAAAVTRGRRDEFARFAALRRPGGARAHPRPERRGDLRSAASSTGTSARRGAARAAARAVGELLRCAGSDLVPRLARRRGGGTLRIDGDAGLRVELALGDGCALAPAGALRRARRRDGVGAAARARRSIARGSRRPAPARAAARGGARDAGDRR